MGIIFQMGMATAGSGPPGASWLAFSLSLSLTRSLLTLLNLLLV